MATCRSIPPEEWVQVLEALVMFFRYSGSREPEDEAQNTLVAMFVRDDYEFAGNEDIHKVARGFARKVLHEARRKAKKEGVALDPQEAMLASPAHSAGSARAINARVYLEQVLRIAGEGLRKRDMEAIRQELAGHIVAGGQATDRDALNRQRVRLHRSRGRLFRLLGFPRSAESDE